MRQLFVACFLVVGAAPAVAQEAIALGTPITFAAPPNIASYVPKSLILEVNPGRIVIVIVSNDSNARELTFEYPRDCGSFGSTNGTPNPPTCPNHDTSAEVQTLITQLNTVNLTTRSLWRRVFDRLVADFPSRFNGGGTVQ